MIGKNFIVKNAEIFSEHNAKKSPENSTPLPRNRKKYEMTLLSYDVNDLFNFVDSQNFKPISV